MPKMNSNIDIVSFDLYNTLIRRSVRDPLDIFSFTEKECRSKGINCPNNYLQIRKNYGEIIQKKYSGCATISQIYNELALIYPDYNWELIKEIEIEIEKNNCHANSAGIELYRYYKINSIPIIIVSDMYLSSYTLSEIMSKCGVKGYEKLYVSCETKMTKGKGDLFDYVLKDRNIKPYRMLHIGDSWRGDFIIPLLKGIRVHHIVEAKQYFFNKKMYDCNLDYRAIMNVADSVSGRLNFMGKLGSVTFGPLLYGFTKWLDNITRNDDIDMVLFMSRDGFIMKKSFELLGAKRQSKYLYGSRRAFTVPLLWKCETIEDVRRLIPFPHRMSMKDFVERLGLENYSYDNSFFNIDIEKKYENDSLFEQPYFNRCYQKIMEEAKANSYSEYKNIARYIKSLNLHGNVGMVDIGYHGSIQFAFEKLLEELKIDAQVSGYYVVIANEPSHISQKDIKAIGYLGDCNRNQDIYKRIRKFVPLFELAFLAPHGSTKNFSMDNGRVNPALYDFEYERRISDYNQVREFQNGAIEFCALLNKTGLGDLMKLTPEIVMLNYIRMGTKPTMKEAMVWGDLSFFEYSTHLIAKPRPYRYYLQLARLRDDFMNSYWKIGFLKRICRISIPYELIYDHIKKINEKNRGF